MTSVYLLEPLWDGHPVSRGGGVKNSPPFNIEASQPQRLTINTGPRARINRQGGPRGPCQTGGRGRAGGRPEAEAPQRPARPPTAPGPRGPAKPAAARARPPARPLTLARGSGSTARGGRGGPCQTGGRGRAGGRPEAEGPQRPARPRTAPGPRGPAKPAAARARPPARPVNTGPRARAARENLQQAFGAGSRSGVARRPWPVRTGSATRCTRTGTGSGPRSAPRARTQNGAGRSRPQKWARSHRSSPAPGRAARRSRSKTRRGPPDRRCAGAASRRGDVSAGATATPGPPAPATSPTRRASPRPGGRSLLPRGPSSSCWRSWS